MHISLSPVAEEIVKQQMALGYSSADQVVERALKLLREESERKLERLRAALIEGEQSGEPVLYDLEVLVAEVDAEFESGEMEIAPSVCPETAA